LVLIASFRDKEAAKVFQREFSKRLPQAIQRQALKRLWMLDAAESLDDLRIPPANHLEALKDDRQGQHSIRINQQWRICFVWADGVAKEVEIVDYH
jgi:proteic killer suppression protein